ncbi:hypothetical protein GCM10027090_15710 [Sinomonas soli]
MRAWTERMLARPSVSDQRAVSFFRAGGAGVSDIQSSFRSLAGQLRVPPSVGGSRERRGRFSSVEADDSPPLMPSPSVGQSGRDADHRLGRAGNGASGRKAHDAP